MKLYIGGAFQGQLELATAENPGAIILPDFHLLVREKLQSGEDIAAFTALLCEKQPDLVLVSDEIGSGIVPTDRTDRVWREAVGRALCMVARQSDQVTRVVCGIGVRIK